MNYSKVQFISWEIYTGPVNQPMMVNGHVVFPQFYPGFRTGAMPNDKFDVVSQLYDIQARVAFTANAIAQAQKSATSDAGTLKIFMGPEFLYRGAGGAYIHDLLNGWSGPSPAEFGPLSAPFNNNWGGLFGGLQKIAANDQYNNWLFVFGTAISAAFQAAKYPDGKYYVDTSKPATAYNTSLIQLGGSKNTAANYASRKHYVSHIDFLNYYTGPEQHIMATIQAAESRALIPTDALGVSEGGAMFNINGVNDATGKPINFGIEVCLDHASSGGGNQNAYGRLRTAGQYAKIQLVPSGGMSLVADSIRLEPAGGPTTKSYAFNSDGLSNLGQPPTGSHTQIWNGANGAPVIQASKLFEASNGAALANTTVLLVPHSVTLAPNIIVQDTVLWQLGAGNVRVMQALGL